VVNNAGILRDKSFVRMTDADWDLVQRVHLRGTYKVTKAAWPYMVKQKYGRIINTASAVGLYGNFGQANYSAAKLGILGLTNTLAREGAKYNIIANTIAPNAGTRMTATIMPPEMVEALKPDYVAPLVAFLGHETCPDTGKVFEVGSCWIAAVRRQRSGGYGFPVNRPLEPEDIAAKWSVITNFDDGRATYPTSPQESLQDIYSNYLNQQQAEEEGLDEVNAKARKLEIPPTVHEYTERDVILYALGAGCTRKDLQFVYENDENFSVLPTYGVVPGLSAATAVSFGEFIPSFNPMMLLHGEQYLEIRRPLPTSGKLIQEARILDVLDKGKAAALTIGVTSKDEQGREVLYNESTMFIRGSGGFGGPKKRNNPIPAAVAANVPPKRQPDVVITEKTSEDQAALYRLSGDLNPLHIDPAMSSIGGFDVPILHGLCTFAISGKHVLKAFCNNDTTKFKSIKARFAKHVFPGETLETSMWREGNKVIFQTRVVERDAIAISNAAVELADEPTKAKL
jgi:multifunctional beta-oxidation protein